ncbi:MAG: hypothetical protein ACREQ9_13905, partial [Candidatus Binatia bacterium]
MAFGNAAAGAALCSWAEAQTTIATPVPRATEMPRATPISPFTTPVPRATPIPPPDPLGEPEQPLETPLEP